VLLNKEADRMIWKSPLEIKTKQ